MDTLLLVQKYKVECLHSLTERLLKLYLLDNLRLLLVDGVARLMEETKFRRGYEVEGGLIGAPRAAGVILGGSTRGNGEAHQAEKGE